MAPFRFLLCLAALWFALLESRSSFAITAEELTTKMSAEQRVSYLNGLITMLAYQTAANGNRDKGNCIGQAFFGGDDQRNEKSWARLRSVLNQYSDKRPEILLTVLADQLCKN